MFNNELNTEAQMIFTVHDINLMDCKRMFRKEQIWFVHKDEEGVYVYSLADFTAQQGVRDTTDIMEKYRKGALGALPDPELINSLLDLKGNRRGELREMKNRLPDFLNKYKVCIICEGDEEFDYLTRLNELKVWNDQYAVDLDNADGNGNIPARYHTGIRMVLMILYLFFVTQIKSHTNSI